MSSPDAKVFFSYARADSDFVIQLAQDLRTAGVQLWLDQLDIEPGQHWDRAIEKALDACGCLIAVLSPAAVESVNVMDEVSFALEEGKQVVPVIYQDCKIPFRLRRLQYIQFDDAYQTRLGQLLKVLHAEESVVIEPVDSRSMDDRNHPYRPPTQPQVVTQRQPVVPAPRQSTRKPIPLSQTPQTQPPGSRSNSNLWLGVLGLSILLGTGIGFLLIPQEPTEQTYSDRVANQLRREIEAKGISLTSVTCPEGISARVNVSFNCQLQTAQGRSLEAEVTDAKNITWQINTGVIERDGVESAIERKTAELAKADVSVSCDMKELELAVSGQTYNCKNSYGTALIVTVNDDQGRWSWARQQAAQPTTTAPVVPSDAPTKPSPTTTDPSDSPVDPSDSPVDPSERPTIPPSFTIRPSKTISPTVNPTKSPILQPRNTP